MTAAEQEVHEAALKLFAEVEQLRERVEALEAKRHGRHQEVQA